MGTAAKKNLFAPFHHVRTMPSGLPGRRHNTLSTNEVIYLGLRSGGGSTKVKLVTANLLEAKSPSRRSR